MAFILPYDSETTGLPDWGQPSEADHQPHIVQLAALLVDEETREISDQMDVIIKPDGWVIPDEVAAIHGITTERAMDEGVPEKEAFEQFIELWKRCEFRVGYNESFDARIMRIATFRYSVADIIDAWKEAPAKCAMKMAKPICKIPAPPKARRFGPYKNPTLAEAYKHFTGMDLADAHSAMADTMAAMDVYFAALRHEQKEAAA
ncbi:MAG: DNA polymerase III subunit epsilon [Gammaproteobacteria bacterium]|nr:DNA polymerase III subunit epsilon [Gammaproteobacteria bacterium]MBJ54718.1 DNA polymerase III subunit epsilon [Gammaproteobacteria bacterium]HBN16147.1 3'-5' exonuclease [Pseudohongiella sp.]|tara:strand:- start:1934 stop:2545 length:612 start_codon:yes stop_codon:yes gene_type:complete